MNDLATIIGSKVRTAIDVNGLLIPANSFSAHLRQFSAPAVFASEGFEPFTMSLGGSMTKVRVGQRYFSILTRHQLDQGKFDFSQVSILSDETQHMVTTEKVVFQEFRNEEGMDLDCIACEFTTPIREGVISCRGWYKIDTEVERERTPKPSLVCAIGYPGYRNHINFETMHYGISPNAILGREAEPSLKGRLSFKPINALEYDPRGLSGAPVFGVSLEALEPTAFLAGIVSEASRQQIHFVSLREITKFLRKM